MTKNCNSKSSFQDYQEGTAHCHSHGTSPFHSGSVTLFLICKCAHKSHKEMPARCRREKEKRLDPLHPPKTALYITLHFKPECPIPFPNSPLQQFRVRLVYPWWWCTFICHSIQLYKWMPNAPQPHNSLARSQACRLSCPTELMDGRSKLKRYLGEMGRGGAGWGGVYHRERRGRGGEGEERGRENNLRLHWKPLSTCILNLLLPPYINQWSWGIL